MEFKSEVTVTGIKRSKGEFEGNKYDSTKFYIETGLDDRSGNAKGAACSEYSMGDSSEFSKYEHLPYPFKGVATFAQVTTGKATKIVLVDLKPVAAVPQQPKA